MCQYNAPTITQVSGCTASGTSTINCPTEGGITITIIGTNFALVQSITVGGRLCTSATNSDASTATCTLPAGAGTNVAVSVSGPQGSTTPVNALSYATPVITQLFGTGCVSASDVDLTGCSRSVSTLLTIIGMNFGPEIPTVVAGSGLCNSVIQDSAYPQQRLYCQSLTGTVLSQPVLVLQTGGDYGGGATISYQQCPRMSAPIGIALL
jgi:hypothetical protein